jgi:hypothetical protein
VAVQAFIDDGKDVLERKRLLRRLGYKLRTLREERKIGETGWCALLAVPTGAGHLIAA